MGRQPTVTTNAPNRVVLGLAVSTEEEGVRRSVQIHNKVHDLQRQVTAHSVYYEMLLAVIAFEVTPARLDRMVKVRIDGLEDRLVLGDSTAVVLLL